jgi:WD40 repeat protein
MRWSSPHSAALVLLLIPGALLGEEPRVDRYGDPLPAGAIARLGTVRWRHGDGASFVAFLPGGKEVLSVGRDEFVRFWDAATGKEVRQFEIGPKNQSGASIAASGAALTTDGKVLAVSTTTDTVRVFDVASGKELWRIDTQTGYGLAFAPDGLTLAVQERNWTIKLLDAATGKPIRWLVEEVREDRPYRVTNGNTLAFSPDGKVLVSAAAMRSSRTATGLIMWNVATGKEIRRIAENNRMSTAAAAFSPDGKLLAWSNSSGHVFTTDASTGKELRQLTRARTQFTPGGLLFAPDNKTLAALDMMGRDVVLWDAATGDELRAFTSEMPRRAVPRFYPAFGTASFSPDGKRLVVGGLRSAIRVLNIETGKETEEAVHRSPIVQVGYAAEGKTIVSVDADGMAATWEPPQGKELRRLKPEQDRQGIYLSPDAQHVITHTTQGQVVLHEFATGKRVILPVEHSFPFTSVMAVSPAAQRVAVSSSTETTVDILLIDVQGKLRRRLPLPFNPEADDTRFGLPPRRVATLLFSPDGQFLAAHYDGEQIMVWNLATGKEQCRIGFPRNSPILTLAFSRDGKTLLVDVGGEAPGMWETATGKERRAIRARTAALPEEPRPPIRRLGYGRYNVLSPMNTVALSPDGRLLARARPGGVVQLWDVGADKEVGQLKGHRADVTALAFASDGKTLTSGSADTTLLLWDIKEFAANAKSRTANLDASARWADLIGDDAIRAFDAVHEFAAAPKQAVEYIRKNLRPEFVDTDRIERLIADLDSEEFAVRKQASTELLRIGESALPLLRKALEGNPTLEARKRIEEIVKKADRAPTSGETLRSLRAIEVLETIGTAEAKAVLQDVAKGKVKTVVTLSAQAALERLGR